MSEEIVDLKKWYVVRAVSGQENKIRDYMDSEINRLGFKDFVEDILVPTQKVVQIRKGKKINKEKVYFPGYIMIKANLTGEIPHIIKALPNVIGFLGETKDGENEESELFVPYTTRQQILKGSDKLGNLDITFNQNLGGKGAVKLENDIKTFLKKKKSIDPTDPSGIRVRNVADELDRSLQFANALQIIVTFVGIGTLIAGIIGISNIMVFIVKERTKELGIRKALGAEPNEIIKMILTESVFITSIAGVFGMISGIVILNSLDSGVLQDYFITRAGVDLNIAFFATVILIIFGVIAGYIPAKRAAQIKPIVALRDE